MSKETDQEVPDRIEAPCLAVEAKKERQQQLLKALYLIGPGVGLYLIVSNLLHLIGSELLRTLLGILFGPISFILIILGLYRLIRFLFTKTTAHANK